MQAAAVVETSASLREVPIDSVRANPISLRRVDLDSEEFRGLVRSMKASGRFLGAITARELVDTGTGQPYYEIVDGLHRWTAAREAGLPTINIDVVSLSNVEVIQRQIAMNAHVVPTKPIEYTTGLKLILDSNPNMTSSELAASVGKSTEFINERLSLLKITDPGIKKLIDDGAIKLGNALLLAKLPPEDQPEFKSEAAVLGKKEFEEKVLARIKANRDRDKAGKDKTPVEWQPTAHVRKIADLKAEAGVDGVTPTTGSAARALIKGDMAANDAFNLGIKWALSLDPISVANQKAAHEKKVADKEAAAAAKREESLDKAEMSALQKKRTGDLELELIGLRRSNSITPEEANARRKALQDEITAEREAAKKAQDAADAKAKKD